MRFLVDETCGPVVANWLAQQGHDVRRVAEVLPGLDDAGVLGLAYAEERILITNDKDFGARVFERRERHRGVILLRLADERPAMAIAVLTRVLESLGEGIKNRFTVASERRIRPVRPAADS